MPTQYDANLEFIASKGFDTSSLEGHQKTLVWIHITYADNLFYGEPSRDEFDIMVGEMRRPVLIESV